MIDILFPVFNRRAFAEASMRALVANTDWSLVRSLWIYDDGSTDGAGMAATRIACACHGCTDKITHYSSKLGSPVAIMNHFFSAVQPELFAKIDSDTVVPAGWLNACLATLERFPGIDLLGIENYPRGENEPAEVAEIVANPMVQITDHVGGIGLFRGRAFQCVKCNGIGCEACSGTGMDLPIPNVQNGFNRYGLTEFMWRRMDLCKAWLIPPLKVFLLDHLPMQPWRELSSQYCAEGWQRDMNWVYSESQSRLWDWWISGRV